MQIINCLVFIWVKKVIHSFIGRNEEKQQDSLLLYISISLSKAVKEVIVVQEKPPSTLQLHW